MFMNVNILCKKLRIIAGIENYGKAEYIASRFLEEWIDVVVSCGVSVEEKIFVMKDIARERIFIHGFCYIGKERDWYKRKVIQSLVHEIDKYGELVFIPEVFHPQRSITDFAPMEMKSNLEMNSKDYSGFFEI